MGGSSSSSSAVLTTAPPLCFPLQEAVVTSNVTYIQCALLYTSSSGERRIRVHTMVVPVVSELADMYRWEQQQQQQRRACMHWPEACVDIGSALA
jgi:hypothetical protein